MNNIFRNKIGVISGAGSGLGRSLAKQGSKLGMRLVLVDSRKEALEQIESELEPEHDILKVVANVSLKEQMDIVASQTFKKFGVPNFVFNNAGVATSGFVWEHSLEEWKWLFDVNVMGVVNGVHIFTPRMLGRAKIDDTYRGRIINTASMAGLVNVPLGGVYNASKHAIVGLTETLHHDLELITDRVKASVICPHFFPTAIGSKETSQQPSTLSQFENSTPSRSIGAALVQKAISSSKVSADTIAEHVFASIAADRFYIVSHPQALGSVRDRMEDIVSVANPRSPYAARPDIGAKIKKAITDAYDKFDN